MCRRNSQATGMRPDGPLKHASAPRLPADRVMATSLCPSTFKGERVADRDWKIVNPGGTRRVVVTKELPGERWLQLLTAAECRVEIAHGDDILAAPEIVAAFGGHADAAIGQLTEDWSAEVLGALRAAGALVYSQYAVGYDNVDVAAATRLGLPVGNTPGVLTETTAEMAVALTFAAARRVAEGDRMMRAGAYHGWLPTMLLGSLLCRGTLGIVGAGRIGAAYARMMVEGHRMDLVYYDVRPNEELESCLADYSAFLVAHGERPVTCRRAATLARAAGRLRRGQHPRGAHRRDAAPHRRPRAGGHEGGGRARQRQSRPARRRGRPRRPLPHAPALPRRPRRLRERARHGARPRRARQRRARPPSRLGHDLDPRGHGDPGSRQRRRDPPGLAGVAGGRRPRGRTSVRRGRGAAARRPEHRQRRRPGPAALRRGPAPTKEDHQ